MKTALKLALFVIWIGAWVAIGGCFDSHRSFFSNHFGLVMMAGAVLGMISLIIWEIGDRL